MFFTPVNPTTSYNVVCVSVQYFTFFNIPFSLFSVFLSWSLMRLSTLPLPCVIEMFSYGVVIQLRGKWGHGKGVAYGLVLPHLKIPSCFGHDCQRFAVLAFHGPKNRLKWTQDGTPIYLGTHHMSVACWMIVFMDSPP